MRQSDIPPGQPLAAAWHEFATTALPANVGADQYRDMRAAFYTGVLWLLASMTVTLRDGADATGAVVRGVEYLEAVRAELAAYGDELTVLCALDEVRRDSPAC